MEFSITAFQVKDLAVKLHEDRRQLEIHCGDVSVINQLSCGGGTKQFIAMEVNRTGLQALISQLNALLPSVES